MQKTLTAALCGLIVVTMLAACGAPTPTPTESTNPTAPPAATNTLSVDLSTATLRPSPSATPEPSPTPEQATPTPGVDEDQAFAAAALDGTLWTWVGTTYNDGTLVKVADPLRYTLQFLPAGELKILADCNLFNGAYTLDRGGYLTEIEVGAGTKMACPPDSQSTEFIAELGVVALGSKIDGYLVLDLFADSGSMKFAPQILLSFPEPAEGAAIATAPANRFVLSGPDASFSPYGVLTAGTRAEIVGKFTPWWALRLPGHPRQIGWVHQQSVRFENIENVPSLPALPEDFARTYNLPGLDDPQVIITDATLIRAAPDDPANPTQPVVAAGMIGTNLFVLGRDRSGENYLVHLPHEIAPVGMGWIAVDVTHAINTEAVPVIPNPPLLNYGLPIQPVQGAPSAVPRVTIFYRSGPGLEYEELGFALKGQVLPVLGSNLDRTWLQVQVSSSISKSRTAWIAAPNVYVFNPENVQVVPTPFPNWMPTETRQDTCAVNFQSPVNGRLFRPDQDFTVEFELINNTKNTWTRGETDIVFVSSINGGPLHTGADILDITNSVLPGNGYRFSFKANSTRGSGDISEVWAVFRGSEIICSFSYRIFINPPTATPTFTPWPTQTGTIQPTPPPDVPPTPTVGTPEPTNPPEVSPTPRWGG